MCDNIVYKEGVIVLYRQVIELILMEFDLTAVHLLYLFSCFLGRNETHAYFEWFTWIGIDQISRVRSELTIFTQKQVVCCSFDLRAILENNFQAFLNSAHFHKTHSIFLELSFLNVVREYLISNLDILYFNCFFVGHQD